MVMRDVCPRCQSPSLKKHGHLHNGTHHHHGYDGGRQCVQCCEPAVSSETTRVLSERILRERIALRGLCRAVGVGLTWL
jgi:hypothetical protein